MHLIWALVFLLAVPASSTTVSKKFCDAALYFGLGSAMKTAAVAGQIGWAVTSPFSSTMGKEFSLFSTQSSVVANHLFAQMLKSAPFPSPHTSWQENQELLSHVPAATEEEKTLTRFLENRWLAKATGFFPSMIHCFLPSFKLWLQVHPETKSSYARNPSVGFSKAYLGCVEEWRLSLHLPKHLPLILTRPCDVTEYLPKSKVLLDFTHLSQKERAFLLEKHREVPKRDIICFEQLREKQMGGIALLPLPEQTKKERESNETYMLEWISLFGLTANRVELDRFLHHKQKQKNTPSFVYPSPSETRESLLSFLSSYQEKMEFKDSPKKVMVEGTVAVLKGLLERIDSEKILSAASVSIASHTFAKIKNALLALHEESSFFTLASQLEEVHAHLSALLEIYSPFNPEQFHAIYLGALKHLPARLKPMTRCALHAAGMTSIAGIFKAVEKTCGKKLRLIYGENTYFECIKAAELISQAVASELATEEDWKEVDLILAQFNPALKRIDFPISPYKVENIKETLYRTLALRNRKPLTLAIDCTIDYIDSPRLNALLDEFQEEIASGQLCIACYRSGLKFDLFGMDNYAGAPFFTIHNSSPTWKHLDALLTDPVLVTEQLSTNWFCLAYTHATPYLEQYRTHIFENTRALLSQIPHRLFESTSHYRVIPVAQEGEISFLDIKVFGPFHVERSSALAAGALTIQCLEKNQPIFSRPSIGFYHPNFTMIFGKEYSTIRLTLGLDPTQVPILTNCLNTIDALNH